MENHKMAKAEKNHDEIYDLGNRVARSTVAVIDTVVQRGGFKGEELSTIGTLRDEAVRIVQLCEQFQSEQEVTEEK
jgi:hypothetical protein|tara:strand:+ start:10430 stop:10657 length:228 start_codon:yes stop_codon:yes gene_type:complete